MIPKRRPPKASPQQRALSEWRGIDVPAADRLQRARGRPVAGILPGVLQGLGLDRRRAETEILKVWNQLIDPNLTTHAQPVGLRGGTLFVTVDSSPWLDEIVRYRRREILGRLQNSFGGDLIQRISFRLG